MRLLLPETLCPPAVRAALLSVYESGRIPHACILEGLPEQTLALAKWLAQAAVCTAPGERPCGQCAGCIKAKAGSHPDITLLGGEGGSRSFHKEDILMLRSRTFIRPNEAPCRVFLLQQAQNLSTQAQNALLKILEEPPANVQYLLTCDHAASLLATVRSRAQVYTLLPQQQAETETDALVFRLAAALCEAKESTMLYLTAPLVRDRSGLQAVLEKLTQLFRDALALRCGGRVLSENNETTAQLLARTLTRIQLYRLTQTACTLRGYAERNVNTALLATCLCAQLRQAAGR